MKAEFDPAVIQKMAQRMYDRTASMVAVFALSGAVVGGVAGAGYGLSSGMDENGTIGLTLVGAAVAAFGGYLRGESRVLALRVEAQKLLLQLQIEKNTRGPGV